MRLKKIHIFVGMLLVCFVITASYYAIATSKYGNMSLTEKKQAYTTLKAELKSGQEELKKISSENPNEFQKKLSDLKQKAIDVQNLAKEVDTEAYYQHRVEVFLNTLEISIKQDKDRLNNSRDPLDASLVKKMETFIKAKEELLAEYKGIVNSGYSNSKQLYEEIQAKMAKIREIMN